MEAAFQAAGRPLDPKLWYKHIDYASLGIGVSFLAMSYFADFKDYGKTFASLTPGLIITAGSLTPLLDRVSNTARTRLLAVQVTMVGVAAIACFYGTYKGYFTGKTPS